MSATRLNEASILRRAGLLEQFHITRHYLGFDACVIVAAQYKNTEHAVLTEARVIHALRHVVETHPALSVCLVGESTNRSSFRKLDRVDLSKVVSTSESEDLQGLLESQLSLPFDTKADLPLWRVVIAKNNYLLFAWHHSIGDGRSGAAFHVAFYAALQKENPNDENDLATTTSIIPPSLDLIPAIEDLVNIRPSWAKVTQGSYDFFAPTSWTRAASAWTGNAVVTNPSLRTNVRIIDFAPEEAHEMLLRCRKNNATLTSLFHTLAITVVSTLIPDPKTRTIPTSVPVSLRNFSGASPDAFCDHVSTIATYQPTQQAFSWQEASRFAAFIKSSVPKCHEELGMLNLVSGNYPSFFQGRIGKKRRGGIEVSNLGRLDLTGRGAADTLWSIRNLAFAQSDPVVGSALKLNCIGSPLGEVRIVVTWGQGAIGQQLGETFVQKFEQEARNLLKGAV